MHFAVIFYYSCDFPFELIDFLFGKLNYMCLCVCECVVCNLEVWLQKVLLNYLIYQSITTYLSYIKQQQQQQQ